MIDARKGWTDERVNQIIGDLLRIGVTIAALVVLAGGIAYLIGHGADTPAKRIFASEPMALRSVPVIVRGALSWHSLELIQFGLLLLIATPIARVAFSVLAFALQRDRTYVIVTLIVLSLLMFSLAGLRY
jgi:uncharacterized membrane protein